MLGPEARKPALFQSEINDMGIVHGQGKSIDTVPGGWRLRLFGGTAETIPIEGVAPVLAIRAIFGFLTSP